MEITRKKSEWIVNKGMYVTICLGVNNGDVEEVRIIVTEYGNTYTMSIHEASARALLEKLAEVVAEMDSAKVRTRQDYRYGTIENILGKPKTIEEVLGESN